MSYLSLKPSEILYSQSSIANKFTNGDHGQIGEVLDDIMEDRLTISELPEIEVKCIDGSYVSCDNRRLWILKQLERLGRVNEVSVKKTGRMPRQKSARTNNVRIRGMGPGGIWAFKDIDDVDEVCFEMNSFNFY
jgi:hypothetical protein